MKNPLKRKKTIWEDHLDSQLKIWGLKKKDIAIKTYSEVQEGSDEPTYFLNVTILKGIKPINSIVASNADYSKKKYELMRAEGMQFIFKDLERKMIQAWLAGLE